jgi:hypothetical protein
VYQSPILGWSHRAIAPEAMARSERPLSLWLEWRRSWANPVVTVAGTGIGRSSANFAVGVWWPAKFARFVWQALEGTRW